MATSRWRTIITLQMLLLVFEINSSPVPVDEESIKPNENSTQIVDRILIDQRQNGTENYRITIDGVVVAISSLESLLSATLSDLDIFDEDFEFDTAKPAVLNSTQSEIAVTTETALSTTTTTTTIGNSTKNKRRRFGVSGLMRTILKRKFD